MSRLIDLTGQRFSRLIVLEHCGFDKRGESIWKCKCDCGNEKNVLSSNLRGGKVKSCGCYATEVKTKHGKARHNNRSRLYVIWWDIKSRTTKPNNEKYKYYGGRGIEMCNEWKNDFVSFQNWALENGYADNLTIDRIDVNGNYEPSNCRWITRAEQLNNRRNSRIIEYNGRKQTAKQWADEIGINYKTLLHRLDKLDPEEAFTKPVKKRKR